MTDCYDGWCCLQCGECKHFQVDADRREDTTCKRIDHKKIQFARPYFKSYDCGQFHSNICSEFEPNSIAKWLKEHWTGIYTWISAWENDNKRSFFDNNYTVLTLNGDNSVRYYVKRADFFNGTFVNSDGSLKWVKKCYTKASRKSPTGYQVVWEQNTGGDND